MRMMGSAEDPHDVGLLHDEELVAVDLDLGARPFAEQHLVAGLHSHGLELAVFAAGARTCRDDLAGLRLLRRRVGNDDATFSLLLLLEPFDHDAIMQGTKFHCVSAPESRRTDLAAT